MNIASEIDALAHRLRPHYSHFLDKIEIRGEILLTGHSHQAWPDIAREAQLEAWDDAARLIDDKWDKIFGELLPELFRHIARRIGSSRPGDFALAPNTHELVYRLASCFPRERAIVSTDSEFHSLSRQLARFAEDGTPVIRVPVEDERGSADSFAERFLDAVDRARPAWAALSSVLFTTSRVVTALGPILDELARRSIPVLVDAYHAFNVLDFEADRWPGDVFVTGGGYKYAECGEGVCWMLLPADARAYRPRSTGWFSHFEGLESGAGGSTSGAGTGVSGAGGGGVAYGAGGFRFFGATFDPTAVYRAVRVFRFMDEQGLTPRVLRAQSLLQTSLIIERYDALGLAKRGLHLRTPREARGGFVALSSPHAKDLASALRKDGVRTDTRGELLRLGPAPYLDSTSILRAMDLIARRA